MSAGHQTITRRCACGAHITKASERCKQCHRNRFSRNLIVSSPATIIPNGRWEALRADRDIDDPSRANVIDAIAAKYRSARLPWQE